MRPRLGTRARMALLAMLAVAPALALADGLLLTTVRASELSAIDHSLAGQAALLQAGIDNSNGRITFGPTGAAASSATLDAVVVSGHVVVTSVGDDPLPAPAVIALATAVASAGMPQYADIADSHGNTERAYAMSLDAGGDSAGRGDQGSFSILVVSQSISALAETQRNTLVLTVGLSLLTLLVTGVVGRWLAGRVLRPVRMIASLARTVSERDLHRRVEVSVPPDELGELVATFNAMLGRLEADFEGLRRFTADASHELRAPLALMRGELELGLNRVRTPTEQRRTIRALLSEVDHLTRITEGLLLLARADAGTLKATSSLVDLVDLATETATRWQTVARRRRIAIRTETPPTGSVEGDPILLRRLLDNVVDNAVRHSPSGAEVLLRVERGAVAWHVDVMDAGPGVPTGMRSRLFTRFAQDDSARTPGGTGSAGLGLALSAAIARLHGGELTLVDRDAPGACFRLSLPVTDALPVAGISTPKGDEAEGDSGGASPQQKRGSQHCED